MTAAEFPDDLKYTSEHEWARREGELVRVGITFYAQDALGDVVYVELPETGAVITQDAPFGEIQSPKAVSDLYAPVTGEIVERNEEVIAAPELINDDPYGKGWLVTIEPAGEASADLLTSDDYKKLIEQ